MKYEVFDELYGRIDKKLHSENVVDNGDEISVYTLATAINSGMNYFNYSLVDEAKRVVKYINKKINRMFFLKSKCTVPYIYKMCPGINESGERYIEIIFVNSISKRIVGKGIIDEYLDIKLNFYNNDYDKDKTTNVLKEYLSIYDQFINALGAFKQQYPDTPYQWNKDYEGSKEYIDDGFITISLNLERLNDPCVSFSDSQDLEIGRTFNRKYGKLYEFIDFYKTAIMKKTKVNINDLNSLYQTIVRKQIGIYDDVIKTGSIHM